MITDQVDYYGGLQQRKRKADDTDADFEPDLKIPPCVMQGGIGI